jgi:LacI family transcriptional regulator
MSKKVTIKDIAKRANVSIASVSYVLNNTRYVSPEKIARIEQAIEELGYTPNLVARSLRQNRTKTIGLIIPDSSNPFFAEIAKGVEDAGFSAGYSVILCNSNAMPERELTYLEVLRSKQVDGIIFIATTAEFRHIRPLIDGGIPAVIFYRDTGDMSVDQFLIDNDQAGSLVTGHLIDLGHHQIACIQPASTETPSALRVTGFKRVMDAHGLSYDEALMPRGDNLIAGGARATYELLKSGRPFTAVFSTNDAMAIGCIRVLRDNGIRVPDDVSVAGVDDIMLASIIEPPLTTIRQPKYEAGQRAVEMLMVRMIRKYEDGPRQIQLEIALVVRKSTAPPPR